MAGGIQYSIRSIWVFGHAVWTYECPSHFPGFSEWRSLSLPQPISVCVHIQYPDLLLEHGETCGPCTMAPSEITWKLAIFSITTGLSGITVKLAHVSHNSLLLLWVSFSYQRQTKPLRDWKCYFPQHWFSSQLTLANSLSLKEIPLMLGPFCSSTPAPIIDSNHVPSTPVGSRPQNGIMIWGTVSYWWLN